MASSKLHLAHAELAIAEGTLADARDDLAAANDDIAIKAATLRVQAAGVALDYWNDVLDCAFIDVGIGGRHAPPLPVATLAHVDSDCVFGASIL